MRIRFATVALLLVVPTLASAQNGDRPPRGDGYLFFGVLVSNPTYSEGVGPNAGFGVDVFVYRGLGVGAEAGYAGQDWSFGPNGLGVGSVDASYHFLSKKKHRQAEPFISGGYSLYFGDRTAFQNGFNLGGGVNIWLAKHAALRLEVREQDHINHFHSQFTRFVALRIGMTFR